MQLYDLSAEATHIIYLRARGGKGVPRACYAVSKFPGGRNATQEWFPTHLELAQARPRVGHFPKWFLESAPSMGP